MKNLFLNLLLICTISISMAQGHCSNYETMQDSQGNTYETVQFGKQCWMKENMRTLLDAEGNPIILVPIDSSSYDMKYAYYPGNDENNVTLYGLLYNWAAAQTICPHGWHLPNKSDYFALTDFLDKEMNMVINEVYLYLDRAKRFPGYENFTKGKALADTIGWDYSPYFEKGTVGNNQQTNNKSNFSARPAGNKSWIKLGSGAYFWLSSYYLTPKYPLYMQIQSDRIGVYIDDFLSARCGMSVRCIRNNK